MIATILTHSEMERFSEMKPICWEKNLPSTKRRLHCGDIHCERNIQNCGEHSVALYTKDVRKVPIVDYLKWHDSNVNLIYAVH